MHCRTNESLLRRTHRQRKLDYAVTEQVLRASPDRVQPKCPHFGLCGGCALQHLAPAAQLAFKQSQLVENLARLGAVHAERLLEPLPGSGLELPQARAPRHQARAAQGQGAGRLSRALIALRGGPARMPRAGRAGRRIDHAARADGRGPDDREPRAAGRSRGVGRRRGAGAACARSARAGRSRTNGGVRARAFRAHLPAARWPGHDRAARSGASAGVAAAIGCRSTTSRSSSSRRTSCRSTAR